MPNQHSPKNPAPRRCRQVRFTDAEWTEIKRGARVLGVTRSDIVRGAALMTVRRCAYCPAPLSFTDCLPVDGGRRSAHAACAMRASLAAS